MSTNSRLRPDFLPIVKPNDAELDQTTFAEYERRKAEWQLENPGSTPAEYEAAIKAIAEECGV